MRRRSLDEDDKKEWRRDETSASEGMGFTESLMVSDNDMHHLLLLQVAVTVAAFEIELNSHLVHVSCAALR